MGSSFRSCHIKLVGSVHQDKSVKKKLARSFLGSFCDGNMKHFGIQILDGFSGKLAKAQRSITSQVVTCSGSTLRS